MFRVLTGVARQLRHYSDRFVLPSLDLYEVQSAAGSTRAGNKAGGNKCFSRTLPACIRAAMPVGNALLQTSGGLPMRITNASETAGILHGCGSSVVRLHSVVHHHGLLMRIATGE